MQWLFSICPPPPPFFFLNMWVSFCSPKAQASVPPGLCHRKTPDKFLWSESRGKDDNGVLLLFFFSPQLKILRLTAGIRCFSIFICYFYSVPKRIRICGCMYIYFFCISITLNRKQKKWYIEIRKTDKTIQKQTWRIHALHQCIRKDNTLALKLLILF